MSKRVSEMMIDSEKRQMKRAIDVLLSYETEAFVRELFELILMEIEEEKEEER